MSIELLVLIALAGIAVLSSLGVLLSKDNFYSSLYMSATLIFVASIYAIFNLQPVFVLIVFIFVGAIGIVTVAVAATYRSDPESQFSKPWAVLVVITAAVVGFAIYSYKMLNPNLSFGMIEFELINFMSQSEYLILVLALVALVVLLLLSVLKMVAWGTDD
ncbi:NADH-quinone oxidoreductase subunit J [Methanophagales archaeon]|nr:NADH-quinone oxidoreductase subunit J [Methanophagales archaeon]